MNEASPVLIALVVVALRGGADPNTNIDTVGVR